jgi:hypothetical protein
LVTVVISTAIIPTLVAQRFFLPVEEMKKLREEEQR